MSPTELAPAFFLSVVVILVVCRLVGLALRSLGQPPVVGEMVAGVVLGPSVLGLLAPGVESQLFPAEMRPVLYVVGQIGLVVFMFQAGYEFHTDRIRPVARAAASISASGIVAPLALGAGLTFLVHGSVDVFPADVSTLVSALFVGVTLSITAFPMLARIITERGLTGSRFGSIALASGALDDAVAWVMLAGVLSLAGTGVSTFLVALLGAVGLAAVLAVLAKARGRATLAAAKLSSDQLLLATVVVLFLAAWYTDRIGLYAVFGAFSLGLVLPRSEPVDRAVAAISPVSRIVFLPLFFTYSGLNTNFSLLSGTSVLLFTAACVVLAVVGKLGACWLAARLVGEKPEVALRVGTLMNARGLMQLIAINVGLAAGIVSPAMFSVLVVVALVTTVMATPLLSLWDRIDAGRAVAVTVELVSTAGAARPAGEPTVQPRGGLGG
ncbi:cation:proton antiporter [Actinacidiphila oryziradicis]|uniref:Cation:proton antiporter n=1 Tax=Actinacidiphila oryziradicis TaxID=2571141 RepID=A0A4U0RVI0_9ACTN|nr:cation:proton antiporter [Actinacidiphila oryziradicis]TKA00274.1 cation:proton antiporter [Actinacidiphila oryziradicis]